MEIVKSNIWEIKKSGSLKTLGGLLALFHVALFAYWIKEGNLPIKLSLQGQPMCWSFMENCGWMHLPTGVIEFVYYCYVFFAGFASLVLILTEWVSFGFYLLLIAIWLGMALYFQDVRLSTNDGYFIFFVTFAYLYIPSKHRLMRTLLVSFFVARGLSQLAADWLAGSWYMEHMHVPAKAGEWFAAISVLVQMIGGVTLLLRDARYFLTGWISLFIFACITLYVGEYLTSCLALGSLVYIAMDELELRKAERQYIYQSFIRPEPSFIWGGVLLAVFWAAQLSPFMNLPRKSGLKSALNVFTLHPEAAHEECDQKSFAVYKNRTEELDVEPQLARQPAMFCNPYLRYLDLKAACQEHKKDPDFITISSVFQVRNFREHSSYRAFEVKDFCADGLTFKKLGEVQWTMNPAK